MVRVDIRILLAQFSGVRQSRNVSRLEIRQDIRARLTGVLVELPLENLYCSQPPLHLRNSSHHVTTHWSNFKRMVIK